MANDQTTQAKRQNKFIHAHPSPTTTSKNSELTGILNLHFVGHPVYCTKPEHHTVVILSAGRATKTRGDTHLRSALLLMRVLKGAHSVLVAPCLG